MKPMANAKAALNQMDSACVVLDGIYQRSEEFNMC